MSVTQDPISAHGGGELVDRKAPASEVAALRKHAEGLATVALGARDTADLEMIASGAFSPLTGFMGEADYLRSRDDLRLADGLPWSIPITLGVEETIARALKKGQDVALTAGNGASGCSSQTERRCPSRWLTARRGRRRT